MSAATVERGAAAPVESTADAVARPMRVFELRVGAVQQLTPHFRRITLTGGDLALFGANAAGQTLDLRVKAMIPAPGQALPELRHERGSLLEDWYQSWRALEETTRGAMRTYTVRALRRAVPAGPHGPAREAELDIDFVLHLEGGSGPASAWAAAARPGDPLTIIGPCLLWGDCLGIEFAPGDSERILLVGDETAVPAIAAILASLPDDAAGHAVLEVPEAADFLDLQAPAGVSVNWVARGGRPHGAAMSAQVHSLIVPGACEVGQEPEDVDIDAAILWETPGATSGHGLYAWIAGEAAAIRELRRYLVREVGMDRNSVAFMGYWRHGQTLG